MSKAKYGLSSILTHDLIYASSRSTLLMYTGPKHGFYMVTCQIICWSAPPKCITSIRARLLVALFSPIQVKSKIRNGFLPTWGLNMI